MATFSDKCFKIYYQVKDSRHPDLCCETSIFIWNWQNLRRRLILIGIFAGSVRLLRTGASAGTPYRYSINKVTTSRVHGCIFVIKRRLWPGKDKEFWVIVDEVVENHCPLLGKVKLLERNTAHYLGKIFFLERLSITWEK